MTEEDKWIEKYEPIMDMFNQTDLYDTDDPICAVIKPGHIWTLVDGDDGNGYIHPGYMFVNRVGYYITNKPYDIYCPPEPVKCIYPQENE